jgi:hypothetical protein
MPGFVFIEPALPVQDFCLAREQTDKIPAIINGTIH